MDLAARVLAYYLVDTNPPRSKRKLGCQLPTNSNRTSWVSWFIHRDPRFPPRHRVYGTSKTHPGGNVQELRGDGRENKPRIRHNRRCSHGTVTPRASESNRGKVLRRLRSANHERLPERQAYVYGKRKSKNTNYDGCGWRQKSRSIWKTVYGPRWDGKNVTR